jgi:hypothetical protein
MKRVANNKAREVIEKLEEFQGSNMFGKWVGIGNGRTEMFADKLYAVYSYGSHFPMYIYDAKEQKWLGNSDKYSRSTTRQQSHARPSSIYAWYNTDEMKEVIYHGGLVESVMARART